MTPQATRDYWAGMAHRIALPVLASLSSGRLRQDMPVESRPGLRAARAQFTHLEALGRTLSGIAPWLELEGLTGHEAALQRELVELARGALREATEPSSPDFLNFSEGTQPLVDAAFLAQGLLRAPRALWEELEEDTRENIVACLHATRVFRPGRNNWLLFAAIIEAFLLKVGEGGDRMRMDYAVMQHEQWYKGDGVYGDGREYHHDYYNAFVIHPMLLDVLRVCEGLTTDWQGFLPVIHERAVRYAAIQERAIGPDGTIPPVGRSITYRTGALQVLAQMALWESLPQGVSPSAAREALTAVMHRLLDAPGTFDEHGWLCIGFCGHQPDLAEEYISTGSLYLCLAAFLPLGLSPHAAFWTLPAAPWTSRRIYAGEDMPADKALRDSRLL